MTTTGMTLTELRAAHPELFYRQDWFRGQQFMGVYPQSGTPSLPKIGARGAAGDVRRLPRAVDLAHAFVAHPKWDGWRHYWWCADTDAKGQRVYVGGVGEHNGGRLEIHRHLHITDQWVSAA